MERHGDDKADLASGEVALCTRVVVAVLTYQRTEDIRELLPMLAGQADEIDARATVLVVDNDPDAGARDDVERLVSQLGLRDVRYAHEPVPGIAHGRNRALDEAGDADLLVFIDDDERPQEGWLQALVRCQREFDAAAVAGAVVPVSAPIHDPWISEGCFFVRRRHATGTVLPAASTANLLLDLRWLRAHGGLRFDARYVATGGCDTLFTRQLVQRGGRIVWCDDAVVLDHIRPSRLTREWVLQRAYRSANTWSWVDLDLATTSLDRARRRVQLVVLAASRIVLGRTRLWLGLLTGDLRHHARGSRTLARGRGMWAGALGRVYDDPEYERPTSAVT